MIQYVPEFRHVNSVWKVDDVVSVAKYSMRLIEMNSYPIPNYLCRALYNNVVYHIQDIILVNDAWRYRLEYQVKPKQNALFPDLFEIDLRNNEDLVKKYDETEPSNKRTENGIVYAVYGYRYIEPKDFYPYDHIYEVVGLYSQLLGWFIQKDYNEIIEICRGENEMYRHSNIFAVNNDKVYIYKAQKNDTSIEQDEYRLVVTRKIVVDDLKMEDTEDLITNNNTQVLKIKSKITDTYHNYIDIPERYVKLVTLQLKKEILEYISQPIPEELNGSIEKILAMFRAEVEKKEYEKQNKKGVIG